jgi:hypothetical protein
MKSKETESCIRFFPKERVNYPPDLCADAAQAVFRRKSATHNATHECSKQRRRSFESNFRRGEVQQSIRVQILQVNPQSTLRHCLIRQSMCETPSNPGKYGFDLMAKAVFDPVD